MGKELAPLTADILKIGLSELKPVVGGAAGGFAFTKLDLTEKSLNGLGKEIQKYSHLRQVILSNNQISDIAAVVKLKHTLTLQADNNAITSIDCLAVADSEETAGTDLPWCQRLDLSTNKLTALPSLALLERLRFLRLESNEIATLEAFAGHPALEELELQGNKLKNLQGLGPCEKLTRLVVSGNELETLEGLEEKPALTYLNVSANALTTLEHIEGAAILAELDARDNQLAHEEADPLPKDFLRLRKLQKLRTLALSGNPVAEYKSELIICHPRIQVLDGKTTTDEERSIAAERHKEIKQAEAQRAKEREEA